MSDIRTRFERETADHVMTVLHDDGLYRHLRFRQEFWQVPWLNKRHSGMYWFEIITVPGSLTFRGDGESFVFARIEDMFEFFRGPVGRINPSYWAEKLTSHRDGVMRYDADIFERQVKEEVVNAVRDRSAPSGLGRAVRRDVLDSYDHYIGCEEGARAALSDFEFEGFRFVDSFEWNLRDYDWWFLWALHGIVWGIAQYDAHHGRSVQVATPSKTPAPVKARPVVNVNLPEPATTGGAS